MTRNFGVLYLWYGTGVVVFLLWLAASRFGRVRLGDAHEKPEFTTFSWLAMIFCAGVGATLLYWAVIEWGYYILKPPYGLAPGSQSLTASAEDWAKSDAVAAQLAPGQAGFHDGA